MTRPNRDSGAFDLNSLLHPEQAFAHPADVLNDRDLTLSEKRAMLASWASDSCVIDSAPALRRLAGAAPVHFDEIMDALRMLDRQAAGLKSPPRYRRVLAERTPGVFGRGQSPH
jgi:hypothetical protein